ncbi:MAG: ABC transporter permease [Verrucomicrobia bacterium]|jgi:ribose transport system permease protein|nr:ABC transporter permease [Verrucomicrobiota bacterium]
MPTDHHSNDSFNWKQFLNSFGPLLGLLLVIGLFSLSAELRPTFFTGGNAKLILTQTVIVATGALGMTLIIVSGGIDLSAGSLVALSSVIAATLLLQEWSPVAALILTVIACGCIGAINGTIIAGFRMVPFIVTLGMMGIARGAAKWLAGNKTVNPEENALNRIMEPIAPQNLWPLPMGVWITIVLAVLMVVVMKYSIFGRYVFAIGSNEDTARLCGIRVRTNKILIYALAGLFFGLAGVMQYSRLTQGDPTVAIGLELEIIAAVVIGGASLSGGSGSISGTMLGALIMGVLKSGSSQMNWPTYMQEIIIGIVIILAVGLDKWRQGKQS